MADFFSFRPEVFSPFRRCNPSDMCRFSIFVDDLCFYYLQELVSIHIATCNTLIFKGIGMICPCLEPDDSLGGITVIDHVATLVHDHYPVEHLVNVRAWLMNDYDHQPSFVCLLYTSPSPRTDS